MDKRILVLDDDPIVAISCKRVLGDEGFNISTSDRGEEALRMIEKEHFDLFISDIRLPDANGMSVVRKARTVHPEMDVVVITGYPTLYDAKESIKLGALEYIEKPFTPDFLISVVRKAFDKKDWTLKKAFFIEELKDYIVPLRDSSIIQNEEGTWMRPVGEGIWEIGCDVRHWILSGNLVFIDFIKDLQSVKAGETFARLLTSSGKIIDLPSPISGRIKDLNTKVNDALVTLTKEYLSEGWLLKLAKVAPFSI